MDTTDPPNPRWKVFSNGFTRKTGLLIQERIDRAYRDGKDCHVECRLLLPDDSVKHVRIVAHASRADSGIIEFIGAVMDVTERKAAEEKIRGQEMELQQILDLTPQHLAVIGPGGE